MLDKLKVNILGNPRGAYILIMRNEHDGAFSAPISPDATCEVRLHPTGQDNDWIPLREVLMLLDETASLTAELQERVNHLEAQATEVQANALNTIINIVDNLTPMPATRHVNAAAPNVAGTPGKPTYADLQATINRQLDTIRHLEAKVSKPPNKQKP